MPEVAIRAVSPRLHHCLGADKASGTREALLTWLQRFTNAPILKDLSW